MSSLSYSEEVARLRQTQHLAVWRVAPGSAPGGGTAPAALTPPLSMQCSGCCSPLALSAVVTQVPSWPNLCFKMKYVWKTSPSFENISITFQQSSPCSDSSWASFSALPIPPQLIFRLVVVNIFFSIWYLTLESIYSLFTCFLSQFFPSFHLQNTSWRNTLSLLWLWIGVHLPSVWPHLSQHQDELFKSPHISYSFFQVYHKFIFLNKLSAYKRICQFLWRQYSDISIT